MKIPSFTFTSRISSFTVFVCFSLAMLGLANAANKKQDTDSALAVSGYTFRKAASVEPAKNRVELNAPGKVTVTSPVGFRGLKLSLDCGDDDLATPVWIEADNNVAVWKGALTPGKAQEINLELSGLSVIRIF